MSPEDKLWLVLALVWVVMLILHASSEERSGRLEARVRKLEGPEPAEREITQTAPYRYVNDRPDRGEQ